MKKLSLIFLFSIIMILFISHDALTDAIGINVNQDGAVSIGTLSPTPGSKVTINGGISILGGYAPGHVVCWKTDGVLGYCTTDVNTDGTCGCS